LTPLTGYTLLLRLLAPALLAHTAWQALRAGSLHYLVQRLGLYRHDTLVDLWLHAASVGEVNAALPLIVEVSKRSPTLRILVTTTTTSGAANARRCLPEGVEHAYLPIDWPGAVRRFLRTFRPGCAAIMETELWPNLYAGCEAHDVPLVIVNGRLSLRTRRAPRWVCRLYRDTLARVAAVLARTEHDRAGFIALGAAAERVEVVGNIKFAGRFPGPVEAVDPGRPYVVAASTRKGEEKLILRAWRTEARNGHLLVVVPRHPNRRREIVKALRAAGASVAVRSRGEIPDPETEVYLADTFGELPAFLAGAVLVFMGGSLLPRGGQNLLEPALLGKAILFGPHMENFAEEAELLLSENAALRVENPAALGLAFGKLLADPERIAALGERARAVVAARRDMAEKYADALALLCGMNGARQ